MNKKSSHPRWLNILLISMLVTGCTSPAPVTNFLWWKAFLKFGNFVAQTVEQAVDMLLHNVSNLQPNPSLALIKNGYVIEDPTNPLQGTFSTEMKFSATNQSTNLTRIYTIEKPRMVRDSTNSPWQLAPDMKDIVIKTLRDNNE